MAKTKNPKQKKSSTKIDYAEHWKGMPEFNQPGIKPVKSLKVNFATNADMLKFSKMVGQEITAKTQSIWFPIQPEETAIDKRYSSRKK